MLVEPVDACNWTSFIVSLFKEVTPEVATETSPLKDSSVSRFGPERHVIFLASASSPKRCMCLVITRLTFRKSCLSQWNRFYFLENPVAIGTGKTGKTFR